MWGSAKPAEVQSTWADELGQYEGDDIFAALKAMREAYKEYPPTLFQFADLCRDARRRRVASTPKIEGPREAMPPEYAQRIRELVSHFKPRP